MTTDLITAIHESGHAVSSLAYGGNFEYVTIEPNVQNVAGRVHCSSRPKSLFEYGVRLLAGAEAVVYFYGYSWQRWQSEMGIVDERDGKWIVTLGSDCDRLYKLLDFLQEQISNVSWDELYDQFCDEAKRFVAKYHNKIFRFAIALLKHKTLTYSESLDIFKRHNRLSIHQQMQMLKLLYTTEQAVDCSEIPA
jgi:hypothetical protein